MTVGVGVASEIRTLRRPAGESAGRLLGVGATRLVVAEALRSGCAERRAGEGNGVLSVVSSRDATDVWTAGVVTTFVDVVVEVFVDT